MLQPYVNTSYLTEKKITRLRQQFTKAAPFPHLVLPNFFQKQQIERIIKALKKESFTAFDSDLYSFKQSNDLSKSKQASLKSLFAFLNSTAFKRYITMLTGVQTKKKTDASAFIYEQGDYLLPHDDRLETRKIAYTLHLSKNFNKQDGGTLTFFEKDIVKKRITPTFNTLILFPVIINKTFHQVEEVLGTKKRNSVAGWFND